MSNRIGWFMVRHRTIGGTLHVLVHRNSWWRYRYYTNGCWLCRAVIKATVPPEPFRDWSSIKVSEPVYDADGNLLEHGVNMTATAKRQLDAIMADPEKAEAIQKAIEAIRKNPGPR